MKLLLSILPIISNLNGINSLKTLIENDGSIYSLSNLKIDHNWKKKSIEGNDININLYDLDSVGQSKFSVYEQVCWSLDNKFFQNETDAFQRRGIFTQELGKAQAAYPDDIIKITILDYSDNWNSISEDPNKDIGEKSFQSIEAENNNEIYSLDVEVGINDTDGGWDTDGKFDFSMNITSMDDKDKTTLADENTNNNYLNKEKETEGVVMPREGCYYSQNNWNSSGRDIDLEKISSQFKNVAITNKFINSFSLVGTYDVGEQFSEATANPYPRIVPVANQEKDGYFSCTIDINNDNFQNIKLHRNKDWWTSKDDQKKESYDIAYLSEYSDIQVFPLTNLDEQSNLLDILFGVQYLNDKQPTEEWNQINGGWDLAVQGIYYTFNSNIWDNLVK